MSSNLRKIKKDDSSQEEALDEKEDEHEEITGG